MAEWIGRELMDLIRNSARLGMPKVLDMIVSEVRNIRGSVVHSRVKVPPISADEVGREERLIDRVAESCA